MLSLPPRRPRLLLILSATAVAFAGTATAQSAAPLTVSPAAAVKTPSAVTSDPFEGLNRKTFALNQVLYRVAIRPLAIFYHRATPRPLRAAVNNFTTNLSEPVVFINDVLQGHPATAAGTATRFVANTVIGLGGIIDVTGATGLPHHDNGFGLTLGRWGVKTGPYLYIPVLGPTTLRDGTGSIVDVGLSPLTYATTFLDDGVGAGLGVASGLDTFANADSDLKALKALSTDEYAALRSFYLQNRQSQITGGKIDLNALPDFDDPGASAGPATTPAAPGSIAPSATALTVPAALTPGVPVGDAAALPRPATPAEPSAAPTPPPAAPKGV